MREECKILDIIIPAYNAHKTIEKTLVSIANQRIADKISVTIVNDGSDQGYGSIIEKIRPFLDINEIPLQENSGCGAARQIGLENTSLKYVMFVDADDMLYSPLSAEMLLNEFDGVEDIHAVYGSIREVSFSEKLLYDIGPVHWTWIFGSMFSRDFIKKYGIHFYKNSAAEDIGFNTMVKLLSDEKTIRFINDTVYLWTDSNKENRINTTEFVFEGSNEGFVDNMVHSHKFIGEIKGFDDPNLRIDSIITVCRLYFRLIELISYKNGFSECVYTFIQHCRKYYKEIYAYYAPSVSDEELSEIYDAGHKLYFQNRRNPLTDFSFPKFLDAISQ